MTLLLAIHLLLYTVLTSLIFIFFISLVELPLKWMCPILTIHTLLERVEETSRKVGDITASIKLISVSSFYWQLC